MRALVIESAGKPAVRDVAAPRAEGLALIGVFQAGVCGTDLKIAAGEIPVRPPRIMGHEMTGRVITPGPRRLLPAGARVLVNPATWCGLCDLCRRDLPQLCRNGALLGRDADGCFAEFVAVDETLLHPLPPGMRPDEEALLQILSTCVHAQARLRASPGDSAVVVGLGVSGLLHIQLLRVRGAGPIIGITRSAWKRDLALRAGAAAVAEPDGAAGAVMEATAGRGADIAIECAGTAGTLAQAMQLAGAGGTVLAFGATAPDARGLPVYDWYYKELTILGTRAARPRDCDEAIRLVAGRHLDVAPLVTARFPLERAAEALDACRDPAQLKVVIDIAGHS
jgi:L-iditol 2-dehydrogenase